MVPIKYNIRSLRTRWVSSLMTVLGTGLVVWASVLAFGLADGLDHTLEVSGEPLDLIVMRKGATAETNSIVNESAAASWRHARRHRLGRGGRQASARPSWSSSSTRPAAATTATAT